VVPKTCLYIRAILSPNAAGRSILPASKKSLGFGKEGSRIAYHAFRILFSISSVCSGAFTPYTNSAHQLSRGAEILKLGLGNLGGGRPAQLRPVPLPGPYTLELCEDVDPTPDYENVLTD